MANQFTSFANSRYAKARGTINAHFLESYLLPELYKQGPLGISSSGIELPRGTNEPPEFITLSEAKALILNFLIEQCNLSESEQKQINRNLRLTDFSLLAQKIIARTITKPTRQATTISPETLSTLQQKSSPQVNDPKKFKSDQTIKTYNELYFKLLPYARSHIYLEHLTRLCPSAVQNTTGIAPTILTQIILSHLPEISDSIQLYPDKQQATKHLAQIFSTYLNNSPQARAYNVFLGDESIQNSLYELSSHLLSSVDPKILDNFTHTQKQMGESLSRYMPNHSELERILASTLPLTNPNERSFLAKQILEEIIKNSQNPESTLDAIINGLKIDPNLSLQIKSSLQESGQDLTLSYYQGEIRYLLGQHILTRQELKLLKHGINPFLTTVGSNFFKEEVGKRTTLQQYNQATNQQFSSIEEAYINAQKNPEKNPALYSQLREIINKKTYLNSLSHQQRIRVNSTHFGNYFVNNFTRIRNLNRQFTSNLYQINDAINALTGKNLVLKSYINLQKQLDNVTFRGIPIFRLRLWIIENWKKLFRSRIDKAVAISSNWNNYYGRLFHQSLRDFQTGEYSLSGGFSVWRKRTTSLIALKTASLIVKKGTPTLSRAFIRTLIKIGGKSLAKAGQVGIDAIISLSGVASAIGIVLLIKDVAVLAINAFKWLWNKFKNLFPSAEAAIAGLVAGATIGVGAIGSFLLGFLAPVIMATVLPLGIVFGLTFGGTYLIQFLTEQTNLGMYLDSASGAQTIAVSVLCVDNSNTPSARAACLAQYLNECYGGGSITAGNVKSKLSCLAAKAIAPGAIDEIERSALGKTWLQCVGFVKAVAAWVGTAIGSYNACGYVDDPRFVSGLSGVKQGDAIVFKSSGTCSDSAPGHIGILKDDAGANVCLIDANYKCSGCVTNGNCLPKTNVAGYLKL